MKYEDLNESQREEFSTYFYETLWSFSDDTMTSCPWGCPWLHGTQRDLKGDTIEAMADNYFLEIEDEVRSLLEEEEAQKFRDEE